MSEKQASGAPNRRGTRVILGAAAVLAVLGGGYATAYGLAGDKLPPRASVEGVALGGLHPAEAEARLADQLGPRASAPLEITAGSQALVRNPAELGLGVDVAASVRRAGGGASADPAVLWNKLVGGSDHAAVRTRDDAALSVAMADLAASANTDATNAVVGFEGLKPVITEGVDGIKVDQTRTADAVALAYLGATQVPAVVATTEPDITTAEARAAVESIVTPALAAPVTIVAGDKPVSITPEMIVAALSLVPDNGVLAASVDPDKLLAQADPALATLGLKEPKDASFTFVNGRPSIVASVDGMGVGKTELAAAVQGLLPKTSERTASVPVTPQKASFTTADAEKMGVTEVTGEFTTQFPATAYRVNNIGKSAGLVNGTFLKPGDTFSMNKVLGPRTLANGWMAGGAIDGGKVVERMGGGISQTTTTTFNAIFFAGLEDVKHKPHSLYFNRYPMGREATLDYNSVEMIFRNNSPHGVLMQAFTNNPKVGGTGTVTVRVWSTKVYDVKATPPVQSNFTSPGPAIQNPNEICSPQSAMRGFTVTFDRQFFSNGTLVKSEPYRWTYNTLTPVVCTHPNARPDRVER